MKQQILKNLNESFGLEGDDALELFVSYVNTVNENLAEIDRLLPTPQLLADLTRAAHSIKGCALNCGDSEMAAAAKAAEFAGKASDIPLYKENVEKVRELAKLLTAEL